MLYGLDERGKPRAACFAAKDASLARKAAGLMGLRVLPVASARQTEIAARLPVGRIYSSGRGLVPNIRPKLYERMMQALGNGAQAGQAAPKQPPNGTSPPGRPSKPGKAPPLPADWQQIAIGHLVIAQEDDPKDGWWQFIVAAKAPAWDRRRRRQALRPWQRCRPHLGGKRTNYRRAVLAHDARLLSQPAANVDVRSGDGAFIRV